MITHYIYEIPGVKIGCTNNINNRINLAKKLNKKNYDNLMILEELHDCDDKTAGDKEIEWQNKLGYKKDSEHYSITKQKHLHMINSVSNESRSKAGKKGGRLGGLKSQITHRKNKTGLYNVNIKSKGGLASTLKHKQNGTNFYDPEVRNKAHEALRSSLNKHKENKTWIFNKDLMKKANAKAQKTQRENKVGIYSKEVQSDAGKLGSKSCKEKGVGVFRKETCEHCGLHGQYMSMMKYHFDNCKFKKSE